MQQASVQPWNTISCERLAAQPGQRDALLVALRGVAEQLRAAGCELHASPAQDHADVVWMTLVWQSPDAERAAPLRRAMSEAALFLQHSSASEVAELKARDQPTALFSEPDGLIAP